MFIFTILQVRCTANLDTIQQTLIILGSRKLQLCELCEDNLYGGPLVPLRKINFIRNYELRSRYNDFLRRNYEL